MVQVSFESTASFYQNGSLHFVALPTKQAFLNAFEEGIQAKDLGVILLGEESITLLRDAISALSVWPADFSGEGLGTTMVNPLMKAGNFIEWRPTDHLTLRFCELNLYRSNAKSE